MPDKTAGSVVCDRDSEFAVSTASRGTGPAGRGRGCTSRIPAIPARAGNGGIWLSNSRFNTAGASNEWLEPVDDEEYLKATNEEV